MGEGGIQRAIRAFDLVLCDLWSEKSGGLASRVGRDQYAEERQPVGVRALCGGFREERVLLAGVWAGLISPAAHPRRGGAGQSAGEEEDEERSERP